MYRDLKKEGKETCKCQIQQTLGLEVNAELLYPLRALSPGKQELRPRVATSTWDRRHELGPLQGKEETKPRSTPQEVTQALKRELEET